MTPLNTSPAHESSPDLTPPSEATMTFDDMCLEEVLPPLPWTATSHQHEPELQESPKLDVAASNNSQQNNMASINTDYESSAAEDVESYLSSKYEIAEHALLSYSRTNKLDKLKALLEAKLRNEISLDLNYKGHQKQNFSWSALHLASYFGHIKVVELILSRPYRTEVDIDIQNDTGDTPLHKATLTNRAQVVQTLLSKGAHVFIKNCDGLLARELTKDRHILNMLEAAEQVDKNKTRQEMFKAVDNGDLKKLQEYFQSYGSYMEASRSSTLGNRGEDFNGEGSGPDRNSSTTTSETIGQMVDERGNTLLHLAAMRSFKAICVFLLEQGLNPYKKNNLGQTCIDLASYQLRQLFITVKPAQNHLKKLSSNHVSRFEGPLLKKVRILGWKHIYVVLENGVILLFNNRRDSMNKSRRGYKYLESAFCEPDQNDHGTFTVCFSDKSRATFLVTSDHLSNYVSFKSSQEQDSNNDRFSKNQVELIRQKWIDAINDHIRYSTDFIKKGLKFNDEDENEVHDNGDLSNFNHLLPVDTIKSFIQEARAHYSILERHSESLCNLVQSINATNRFTHSGESTRDETRERNITEQQVSSTSGRSILGFIRPTRRTRSNSTDADDGISTLAQQAANSSVKKRNNGLTDEFIEDNWHCILFHLRLLIESAQNTKLSMGQALALMEHQEQLRQNRIQDQDERCRVLEDSLHALARDHHELEKSLSMSQIYHSAVARSMSMSTDLNEYFDAFEDFDDEKTMTPTSMPSDEALNQKIQEVLDEEERSDVGGRPQLERHSSGGGNYHEADSTDGEDDDLRSNCSALTIETISDLNSARDSKQLDMKLASLEHQVKLGIYKHRTRLPSPMVPRDQVSIWSILKNCIGKELSKITMPVVFNEPITMLQRALEGVQHCRYLKMADESDDPVERMEYVCAFIIAGLSGNCHRIIKPFNPLLYETYEINYELDDACKVRALSQQVSHHPPITAAYSESDNFIHNGSVNPKIKFWGRSIEVQPDGQCRIYLKRHKETYVFKSVSCSVHNIIVGKLWFEHRGPMDIRCIESKIQANLLFRPAGWFSNDLHRFDGFISSFDEKGEKKLRFVYGKWSDYINSVDYNSYENYMKETQQKTFRVPDSPDQTKGLATKLGDLDLSSSQNSVNNNSISNAAGSSSGRSVINSTENSLAKSGDRRGAYSKSQSTASLDIPNSRTLWRLDAQYFEEYYNFTLFTMRLNELSPELAKDLAKTDSRFRPDVRKLEEGDLEGAASEKQRLEEKQREARARDKRFKEPSPELLWFDLKNVNSSKEKFWIYKGGHWESKCNPEKFPDLF